eukprot:CAMPEP_0173184204 /NCGR_PEP_ID=MMETSP1141-20130122/8829_1 /TAXON_ID=483371 /ORGANISM="non described non described, Strain CCMP2298" /LENGTH=97 /DNA_ID=CAMNT_0014107515 /DNA_START=450 /DNA_END=743 /DNA_ORIENTATION=+
MTYDIRQTPYGCVGLLFEHIEKRPEYHIEQHYQQRHREGNPRQAESAAPGRIEVQAEGDAAHRGDPGEGQEEPRKAEREVLGLKLVCSLSEVGLQGV